MAESELDRVRAIVGRVHFPGYAFEVGEAAPGVAFVRVVYDEPDVMTGVDEEQRGRRWIIEPGWAPIQVAQTCLKALLTSLEHRAREHFTYRGRTVFNPHFDIDRLWEIGQPREHAGGPIPFGETRADE